MNGVTCTSETDKATALGNFFASVFTKDADHCRCNDFYFTPNEIFSVLKRLKPSTSEPYDGIPPIVYKKCARSLSRPLAHLFNASFMLGEAYATLFAVFRNTYTTDVTTLVRLYKTYVLPHLEYCSQIWNPTRKKQIIKLEKVQKLFTRLLFHRAFQCHNSMPSYNERLKQLKDAQRQMDSCGPCFLFSHSTHEN
ncbi:hypothetical protein COOONC_11552 [Cooperia oncophora]